MPSININIDKAKLIGHEIRRQNRNEEFAPHDEVIMKQIPGNDATIAEAARQEIRNRDAVKQVAIDAATSTDELKAILGLE